MGIILYTLICNLAFEFETRRLFFTFISWKCTFSLCSWKIRFLKVDCELDLWHRNSFEVSCFTVQQFNLLKWTIFTYSKILGFQWQSRCHFKGFKVVVIHLFLLFLYALIHVLRGSFKYLVYLENIQKLSGFELYFLVQFGETVSLWWRIFEHMEYIHRHHSTTQTNSFM